MYIVSGGTLKEPIEVNDIERAENIAWIHQAEIWEEKVSENYIEHKRIAIMRTV